MHPVLAPGGNLLIVPAFESLRAPIDERLGHYRRYSKTSLERLAAQAGFKVRHMRCLNSIGFFGGWLNARVLRRTAQSETQIGIFDSLLAPIPSRLEARVEPPFGQSIFAVLLKARQGSGG
jgi:hypothetical protein